MKSNIKLVMVIKGVFFDLFGTLVGTPIFEDSRSDWNKTFFKYLQEHGHKLDYEEFLAKGNTFFKLKSPPVEDDGLTVYERKLKKFCLDLGITFNPEQLHELADLTNNYGMKKCVLDQKAIPLLKKLKQDKKLILITNFDHYPHIYHLLDHFKLSELFDKVLVSSEVGFKKPNPEIFKRAIEFSKLKPEEIIHVGDAKADVKGALATGITPILLGMFNSEVQNKYWNKKVKTIMSLPEILDIVYEKVEAKIEN
jgi:HAD superfamily hydrolase (TIGR01509 family)